MKRWKDFWFPSHECPIRIASVIFVYLKIYGLLMGSQLVLNGNKFPISIAFNIFQTDLRSFVVLQR